MTSLPRIKIGDRTSLLILFLIMTVVAASTGAIVGYRLYSVAFARQRLRLIETVDSRSHLINAIAGRASRAQYSSQYRFLTDLGETVWVQDQAIVLCNAAGEPERVQGVMFDITQRKIAEAAVKESEARYRAIVESVADGVVVAGLDGTIYDEEMTVSPVLDAAGVVANFVAIKRDVGEKLLLEERLRQAQKMEAVGQLAGGVAHDFNNLLTGIGGYCELVLSELDAGTPMRRDMESVLQLVSRAADLTRQLSLFSRRETFGFRVLNLNDLVENSGKLLARLVSETIELETVVAADVGNVRGDPGQLEQVLMNLVIKEALIGLEGGSEHFAVVSVTDSGHGMTQETQGHVFEPFFTTKDRGKGTGLGLATVYGIAQEHGGVITVDSAPGAGSTFRVYLPQVVETVVQPVDAEDTEGLVGGTETILVVEDQDEIRQLLRRQLSDCGYEVLTAAHPQDAERLYASRRPDIALLLTDIVLPGYDGTTLHRKLAAIDPNLKVLFISGHSDESNEIGQVLHEGGAFLCKPFTRQQLLRQVRQVLAGRG